MRTGNVIVYLVQVDNEVREDGEPVIVNLLDEDLKEV